MPTLLAPIAPAMDRSWPEQGQWTHAAWKRLPDDGRRYERIAGELFVSPPPSPQHQDLVTELAARMRLHANAHKLGKVYTAPVGVRLPGDSADVQPDIVFIRRARKSVIGTELINGAPDLIVEALSPSNWIFDREEKFKMYQRAKVPEYWIVDCRKETIEQFLLLKGVYVLHGKFGAKDRIRSKSLKDFSVQVGALFE